jgi:NADH-quinone oxidoreductase subunit C
MTIEHLQILADHIQKSFEDKITTSFDKDELVLHTKHGNIQELLSFLKNDESCAFEMLIDLCGADYPERALRFDVVYNLLSLTKNQRIRIIVQTDEDTAVPTASTIYPAATWYEREAWDLYGIFFDGNPDLRRILTDYGFQGHPLRKDFPLTGHVELRYNEELKRVVYEPVVLTQDFRKFDNLSPWEGMTNVQLAGDEKAAIPPIGWVESLKIPQEESA